MKSPQLEKNQHLIRAAGSMALGTLSSRILGLLRDMALYAFFSRTVTDAWLVAFRIPNVFRRLFGEGALSASFIPVFIDLMTHSKNKEKRDDYELVCGVFSLLFLILSAITVLGLIYTEDIVRLMAGEEAYMAVEGKFDLTVQMTRIMFVFVIFICMYAYFMAILNALKKFKLAAFAPVLFNVAMIGSTFVPAMLPSVSNLTLAWGVVVGGFFEMAILIPSLIRHGYFPKFTFSFWNKNVLAVFQKTLPGLLSLGILQLTILINTRFAASLQEGANSWIYLADRILELPLALFAVSLGSALLPTLSQLWAQGEKEQMGLTSNQYLRTIFYVSVPCAFGVYFLSTPIVDVLFNRGKFSDNDLFYTSQVLGVYAFAILSYSGVRVCLPSFYAIKNTLFPAVVSGVCLVAHFFLAQELIQQYGVTGLVISTVVSSVLNLVLLLVGFKFLIGSVFVVRFFVSLLKFTLAAFIMSYVTRLYTPFVDYFGASLIVKVVGLSFTIVGSAVVYFAITKLLRCEEFDLIFKNIRRRIS